MVRIEATSEPLPTSDTPRQPTISPAMAGARNCARSSALPWRASAGVHMSVCTPMAMGTPPQSIADSASASSAA